MLSLDSDTWRCLRSAGGGNGLLAAELLRRLWEGDVSVLNELFEQACHQFTASEVGYAVVPHLAELAEQRQSVGFRVEALGVIGSMMAAKLVHHRSGDRVPETIKEDYERANVRSLSLASKMLADARLTSRESTVLIAVVAALRELSNLSLFILLGDCREELYCPSCGEPIEYSE
jgi:hypothetical protein